MKDKKIIVFIGIGSNLGDRRKNIQLALKKIKQNPCCKVLKVSSLVETEPEGGPPQPEYLNAVIKIRTSFKPDKLLRVLQEIETILGRKRSMKNGPRTIDLDILIYDDQRINQPGLQIPHPRISKRVFVLKPLLEIESEIFNKLKVLSPYRERARSLMSGNS